MFIVYILYDWHSIKISSLTTYTVENWLLKTTDRCISSILTLGINYLVE
jgi:hypothetical protein